MNEQRLTKWLIAGVVVSAILGVGFYMLRSTPPKKDPLTDPRMIQLRSALQIEDSGDFQKAADFYRSSLENINNPRDPWYGQGKLGLGRVLVHTDFNEGVRILKEVMDETSYYPTTRAFAMMVLADVEAPGFGHLELHQRAEKLYPNAISESVIAFDLATDALSQAPGEKERLQKEARENLAKLDQHIGDSLMQSPGTKANILSRKAGALLYLGDIKESEQTYREALQLVQVPPTTPTHHNIEKFIRFFYSFLIASNYPERKDEARDLLQPIIPTEVVANSALFEGWLMRTIKEGTHHGEIIGTLSSISPEFKTFVDKVKAKSR